MIPSPPDNSLPRNVKLLGVASLVNDVASEMIFPLMPPFLISVLGGSRFQLGLIEGVAESLASLIKLWSGGWSDRAGKRKVFVVFGYSLAAISRPLIGLCAAPWQLFVARGADRIGKGIRTSPRDALIADSTDHTMHGRAFGFHRAMDHFGAALGPVIATGFLLIWPGQLRALFLLALVPGIIVVATLMIGLKEVSPAGPRAERQHLSLRPFGWRFRVFLAALVVFTLGNSSDAFLIVRASELGVATAVLPLLWCAFHVVKSLANLGAGRAVDRFGPGRLLFFGWIAYAAIYLAFAYAQSSWQMWILFLAYGASYALTEPAEKTLVARLAGDQQRGLSYGWFNAAVGIAALPSSLIFGWLYQDYGALIAFGWGAAMAVTAALLLAVVGVGKH